LPLAKKERFCHASSLRWTDFLEGELEGELLVSEAVGLVGRLALVFAPALLLLFCELLREAAPGALCCEGRPVSGMTGGVSFYQFTCILWVNAISFSIELTMVFLRGIISCCLASCCFKSWEDFRVIFVLS
jgi:hypothetical protein